MQKIKTLDELFHDGNPATGTLGTIVTAAWLNVIQNELANLVGAAGLALADEDDTQVLKAIRLLNGGTPRNLAVDANMQPTDVVIFVDTSGGPITLTLLSAASNGPGIVTIKNLGGGDLSLAPAAGQTVNSDVGGLLSNTNGEVIRIARQSATNWETI